MATGKGEKKCCLVVYSLGAVGLYVLVILYESVCKRGKENYATFFHFKCGQISDDT